jgi:predicted fused transcriptional regulator/phosphomethylpyrimidine kinase
LHSYIIDYQLYSLSMHPERNIVATGQTGKNPFICVWDTNNMETVSMLKDGYFHPI